MPRAGHRRKKTRTHIEDNEAAKSALVSNEALKVPKSLIVRWREKMILYLHQPYKSHPYFIVRSVGEKLKPK